MKIKFLLSILIVNTYIYSVDMNNDSYLTKQRLNKPSVGSRQQDSSQQYGNQTFKSVKGNKYNYDKKPLNNSDVGSTNQSSTQLFGHQNTGIKNFKSKSHKRLNKPSVGGRQSASNQLFGNP